MIGINTMNQKFDIISTKRVASDGTVAIDCTYYTGSGGIAYLYYELFLLFKA
jgi:hypothetical protein